MSQEIVNIVCLKWGTKYPPNYVNRLYHMVERHLKRPFHFYCLTENSSGLDERVEPLLLNRGDLTGWWYKLSLFRKDLYDLEGTILYFDLDVVIVGSIDFLIDTPGDFLIIRGWSRDLMWNSSVMRFRVGEFFFIWEHFLENKKYILDNYNGDQEWIYKCVPDAKNWPKEKILSYKKSLNSRAYSFLPKKVCSFMGLKALDFMDTPLMPEAAIIVFHGKPDPDDVFERPYGLWKKASFIKKSWGM